MFCNINRIFQAIAIDIASKHDKYAFCIVKHDYYTKPFKSIILDILQ